MVYWITGRAGAGKTYTAVQIMHQLLESDGDPVLLDGDHVRKYFKFGFDTASRKENVLHTARIAALLEDLGFTPIVALISPTKEMRQEARKLFKRSKLIYVPGGSVWEGVTYEEPDKEEMFRPVVMEGIYAV